MALPGFNKDSLLIKEGRLLRGTYSSPEAALVDGVDPFVTRGWLVDEVLGFFKMGTTQWLLERTYATPKSGTPNQVIRIDLTEQLFTMVGELYQYDPSLVSLGWSMEENGTISYRTLEVGSDIEPLEDVGLRLDTELVDGRELSIAMYAGKMSGTSLGGRPSGTEHATWAFNAQSTPHPNFDDSLATVQAKKCYGMIVWGPPV